MPDITDPLVIRFVNEQIRPYAEILRALASRTADMRSSYGVQVEPLLVAAGNVPTDPVMDGREDQGVSRLTLDAITDIMALADTVDTFLSGAVTNAAVTLPTVREPGGTVSL